MTYREHARRIARLPEAQRMSEIAELPGWMQPVVRRLVENHVARRKAQKASACPM